MNGNSGYLFTIRTIHNIFQLQVTNLQDFFNPHLSTLVLTGFLLQSFNDRILLVQPGANDEKKVNHTDC